MEFRELIEGRRSVRRYADREVTREQVEEIIKAAQEAPSWKNQQTSKYYCVISKEKREEIRTGCFPSFNEKRSENAVLIVTAFEKGNVGFTDDGKPINELGDGWGCYDLGLQGAYLILKARELGLDTLIMGIRDAGKLRQALDIPENEEVGAVIALGYADESPARPRRRETSDIAKFF